MEDGGLGKSHWATLWERGDFRSALFFSWPLSGMTPVGDAILRVLTGGEGNDKSPISLELFVTCGCFW